MSHRSLQQEFDTLFRSVYIIPYHTMHYHARIPVPAASQESSASCGRKAATNKVRPGPKASHHPSLEANRAAYVTSKSSQAHDNELLVRGLHYTIKRGIQVARLFYTFSLVKHTLQPYGELSMAALFAPIAFCPCTCRHIDRPKSTSWTDTGQISLKPPEEDVRTRLGKHHPTLPLNF